MHMLTPEQAAAVAAFDAQAGNTKVIAFAGAGKTSTLVAMAKANTFRRGTYIAFNKAIATEAAEKFVGTGVTCKTAHSLAFGAVKGMGYDFDKMTGTARSRDFVFKRDYVLDQPDETRITDRVFRTVLASALKKFMQSGDDMVNRRHVIIPDGIGEAGRDWLYTIIPAAAWEIWQQMIDPYHRIPMGHDGYFKLWSMNNPRIWGDFIMVDEAQDLSGVMLKALANQRSQIVAVGDSHQQIYAWRGAVDALKILGGEQVRLTQSFRFGAEIAAAADRVLKAMGEECTLHGVNVPSLVGGGSHHRPDAILCRSNSAIIGHAVNAQANGRDVHTPGGTGEMMALVRDADALQNGVPPQSLDLMGFVNWDDLREFSDTDEGRGYKVFVALVDRFGCRRLTGILSQILDRPRPGCLTVSTAHKAKGLEWPVVELDNFEASDNPSLEERRLYYVAMTRAQRQLWLDPKTLDKFASAREDV